MRTRRRKELRTMALAWTIPRLLSRGCILAERVLEDPPSQKILPVSLSTRAEVAKIEDSTRALEAAGAFDVAACDAEVVVAVAVAEDGCAMFELLERELDVVAGGVGTGVVVVVVVAVDEGGEAALAKAREC
jgi:hypothetical protein